MKWLGVGGGVASFRVDSLRKQLGVKPDSPVDRQMTAFYLGVVEGDVRQALDMSKTTKNDLVDNVLITALYAAIKIRQVRSDAELDVLKNCYLSIIFDESTIWFRRSGIAYSGAFQDDPEKIWQEFEDRLKSGG